MSERDPLESVLRALPAAVLDERRRARTLRRAEEALAQATRPRHGDLLVPALLCLGGLMYVTTAVTQLAGAFASGAPAVTAASATDGPELLAAESP